MKVEGLQKLVKTLRDKAAKSLKEDNVSVIVGYTARYALWVHEMTPAEPQWGRPRRPKTGPHAKKGHYWDPPNRGSPKFLERPARELNNSGVLSQIAIGALRIGRTLAQALTLCGLRIQRESQLLVPVDLGNLKASAFTRVEAGKGKE